MSACDGKKIFISSNIKDLESVKYDKAFKFNNLGYDIYNISNEFYTDNCAPASDDGNDITLNDRIKYYYPSNITMCNEGCEYKDFDFETHRFLCECLIYINNNDYEKEMEQEEKEKVDEQSYLNYVLSLINYKILLCYNLFFQFSSFYYNIGFYISFTTLLLCIILMFLFWINGTFKIKKIFYNNIPTKSKLRELFKKQKEKKIENLNNDKKKVIRNMHKRPNRFLIANKNNLNPPKKKKQKDNHSNIIKLNNKEDKIAVDIVKFKRKNSLKN